MREKARSDYGARLFKARSHARLTQIALAKAAGMSQSALVTAESSGQGSTFTSQLAAACGVRSEWLATGEGTMLIGDHAPQEARPEPDELTAALGVIAKALAEVDIDTRESVAQWLSKLALDPQKLSITAHRIRALLNDITEAPPPSDDEGTRQNIDVDTSKWRRRGKSSTVQEIRRKQ